MFRPSPFDCRDFDIVEHEEKLWMIYIYVDPKEDPSTRADVYALASSEDGVHWADHGVVMRPGSEVWDDQSLWAMSLHKRGNDFTLFYSAINKKEKRHGQAIGIARSQDLTLWSRSGNPALVLRASNPYYSDKLDTANDKPEQRPILFRDPFFFIHDSRKYLIFAAKDKSKTTHNTCVGLAEYIGGRWEFRPPIFSPGDRDVFECPALYHVDERWLLLFCVDSERGVHYAISDNPFGSFAEPMQTSLLPPKSNYVARVVSFKGKNLMYYNTYRDGESSLSDPLELKIENNRVILEPCADATAN